MIIDSCLYNDKNKHDADFVIVGGGLCGLFLSQILKESNKNVDIEPQVRKMRISLETLKQLS